jgi:SpoU rRNA methylase family protein
MPLAQASYSPSMPSIRLGRRNQTRPKPQTICPKGCQLVGIELTDDAIELPSFRHPLNAAYVLGPERGSLSGAMIERCEHIIKIPTSFCLNVQIAGAIVMYDRVKSMGNYPDRALMPGGPKEDKKPHQHGGRFLRSTKPRTSTADKK